jgi:hypothetical protein
VALWDGGEHERGVADAGLSGPGMALKRSVWAIALFLNAMDASLLLGQAGKLRKVWEVDLKKNVDVRGGLAGLPVFALRFSPDGRKLAAIADVYQKGDRRKSRLLIIDTSDRSTQIRQFEVEFGVNENENGQGAALNFGWGPSTEVLYVWSTIVRLASGTTCELPHPGVLVDDDIATSFDSDPALTMTRVTFYNQSCEQQQSWDVSEAWTVLDVSLHRRLLSLLRTMLSSSSSETLIVDPFSRRVLQRWPWRHGGPFEFADSGKAVCRGGALLENDRAPAVCLGVDTGKEIGVTQKNGVAPIATSAKATRVVVSDYRRRKIPFSYEYEASFKGRYVWDFGTGRELVSWCPDSQTYANVFKPTQQITDPFRFAISPDGQYVAEGGGGIVRLYHIDP